MTILCSLSCSVIIAFFVAALSIHAAEASSGNSTNTVEVRVFLDPQNVARADVDVDVGPLVWDSRFAEFARSYDNVEEITYIVASWVTQKQYYDHNLNVCNGPDCTHYTQIVWRNTERVGCANIICNSGDTLAVCEYSLSGGGNYVNSRPY
ncbi:hypothetical protein AMTRI_Chr08g161380 [Amborella trichopoda]